LPDEHWPEKAAREVEARNFIPEDDLGEAVDIVLDLVAD
jgi:hypothetical protein